MSVELQGKIGFKPKFKVQSDAAREVVKSNLLAKGIVERISHLFTPSRPHRLEAMNPAMLSR